MSTAIEKSRITEINTLHSEIGGYLKMTLDKAIRIGELLQEQKEGLKHGEWLPWVEGNLSFTDRTVRNYLRVYENRERLKMETVSDLTDAYRLLEAPKENERKKGWADSLSNNALLTLLFDTTPITPRLPPVIPEDWDYDASVKKVNELMAKAREMLNEHPEILDGDEKNERPKS